jgi:hypothetical protein
MTNQILNAEVWMHRSDPAEAEVWLVVSVAQAGPGVEIRGRMVGPKHPAKTTIEVAYPLRPFPKPPADVAGIVYRVVIPEPNFWQASAPYVYDATLELWQNAMRCDLRMMPGLKLVCSQRLLLLTADFASSM